MATRFFCSSCGKQFEVTDALIGRKVRCSSCGGETRVPGTPAAQATPVAVSPVVAPATLPAGIPVGKPIAGANPVAGLPIGKPVAQPTHIQPTGAMIPAAAEPPRQAAAPSADCGAAAKSEEEQYELVYDDQPAKTSTPTVDSPARGLPVGKPVAVSPTPTSGSQPAPPTAATPVPQPRPVASKSEEENYELVYDDLPAKPAAPTARPVAPGMPVGKPVQPAATPHGLPVGKPVQAKTTPQGLPVGKAVQPTKNSSAAAAPTATPTSAPAARSASQPKPQSARAQQSAAPAAKPSERVSRPANRAAASALAGESLADLIPTDALLPDAALPGAASPDALDAFGGDLLGAEIAPIGRHCPHCLTRLAANSNICPTCGLDSTGSEPTVQELPAELPAMAGRQAGQSGAGELRSVRLGLYSACAAQFLVMIAVILQLLGTMADVPLSLEAPSSLALVAAIAAGLGILCSMASSVLCLVVPKRSGGRGLIFLKNACDAATVALVVAWTQHQLPGNATWLIVLLPIVSIVLFILFMKKLADYLGRQDFSRDVLRLLWKTLGLVGAVALSGLFSAMIGSGTFLFVRVAGLVGWAYVLFHFTLVAQQLAAAARIGPPADKAAS